jgi:hypothetical protein
VERAPILVDLAHPAFADLFEEAVRTEEHACQRGALIMSCSIRIGVAMPDHTNDSSQALARLFRELIDGTSGSDEAFILNTGDRGLLRSLDALSTDDASRSANGGATIAAHARHLQYGLSLMNRWASDGGNPFADARWDEAWKTSRVDEAAWSEIRDGLRDEAHRWLATLASPRIVSPIEFAGMVASIAHLAYHVGAIRQISRVARGPREGTFR